MAGRRLEARAANQGILPRDGFPPRMRGHQGAGSKVAIEPGLPRQAPHQRRNPGIVWARHPNAGAGDGLLRRGQVLLQSSSRRAKECVELHSRSSGFGPNREGFPTPRRGWARRARGAGAVMMAIGLQGGARMRPEMRTKRESTERQLRRLSPRASTGRENGGSRTRRRESPYRIYAATGGWRPQRLKPHRLQDCYGAAKAAPLRKASFAHRLSRLFISLTFPREASVVFLHGIREIPDCARLAVHVASLHRAGAGSGRGKEWRFGRARPQLPRQHRVRVQSRPTFSRL